MRHMQKRICHNNKENLQCKNGGCPDDSRRLHNLFFSQLRDLLNFDVVDKETDTFAVHGIGIERELVVVPFGRIG